MFGCILEKRVFLAEYILLGILEKRVLLVRMMGAPSWVVEYIIGFWLVLSSNIAQRFEHAMMWLLRARVAADQAVADSAEVRPELLSYFADRQLALGRDQTRRYIAHCYTDGTFLAADVGRSDGMRDS